jgi:monoamine oxidase
MRLAGGTGMLVQALARGLPAGCIRLGARVTGLALGATGVGLTVAGSAGPLAARQVIAALPPRLLAATVGFAPAIEPAVLRRWRETPTWMAPHAKFFAVYDRPFWRAAGLSGAARSLVGPLAEIHDATTASGAAALFGFLGLDAGRRAALGEEALTRTCLDRLARLFGAEALRPSATLLKDWSADALTATAEDWRGGAHPVAQRGPWVSAPWQDRLALAGSETSANEPGYLVGAIDAAARAAAETLARLAAQDAAAAAPGGTASGPAYRTPRKEAP